MPADSPKRNVRTRLNTQTVVLAVAALLWAFLAVKTSNMGSGEEELYSRFLNIDNITAPIIRQIHPPRFQLLQIPLVRKRFHIPITETDVILNYETSLFVGC